MFEPIEQSLLDDMIKQIGKSARWKESENKAFIETIDALKQSYAEIERQRALIEQLERDLKIDSETATMFAVKVREQAALIDRYETALHKCSDWEKRNNAHDIAIEALHVPKDASGGVKG